MGPHDVILWPHPYSYHYSSRVGPHHCSEAHLHFLIQAVICSWFQWSPHTCVFVWVIFEKSRCSRRKATQSMGSEWVSHAVSLTDTGHRRRSSVCLVGFFFSPRHKQFSWWQNMQTSGYLTAACRGQCCCLSIVWLRYCRWALPRTQALWSCCQTGFNWFWNCFLKMVLPWLTVCHTATALRCPAEGSDAWKKEPISRL